MLIRLVVLVALTLATPLPGPQGSGESRGRIRGSVADSAGQPLGGVELLLHDLRMTVRTRADGRFEFPRVAPGIYVITARHIGYSPVTWPFRLQDSVTLGFRLHRAVTTLPLVVVNGEVKRMTATLVGFYERLRSSGAPRSSFITREEIEKRNPWRTSDLIRDRGARAVACLRGVIYLDGVPMPGGSPFDPPAGKRRTVPDSRTAVDIVSPGEIEAIEIYRGPATIPSQFNATSPTGTRPGCVILIWTR